MATIFYPQVFVVKALIHDPIQKKYFLIREPNTSSWKPGRFGLPGGKVDPGEDWLAALQRELLEEIGSTVEPQGIADIAEIIFRNPSIDTLQLTHHVVVLCHASVQKLRNGEWHTLQQLKKIPLADLTEYYYPNLWQRVGAKNFQLAPVNLISIWNVTADQNFKNWYSI